MDGSAQREGPSPKEVPEGELAAGLRGPPPTKEGPEGGLAAGLRGPPTKEGSTLLGNQPSPQQQPEGECSSRCQYGPDLSLA